MVSFFSITLTLESIFFNNTGTIKDLQEKVKKMEQEKEKENKNDQKVYHSGLDQYKMLHQQMKAEHNATLTLIMANMKNQEQMYEMQRRNDEEKALIHKQNFERELADKRARLEETKMHYQHMMKQQQYQHLQYIKAIQKSGSNSLKAANALISLLVIIGLIKFIKM